MTFSYAMIFLIKIWKNNFIIFKFCCKSPLKQYFGIMFVFIAAKKVRQIIVSLKSCLQGLVLANPINYRA